MRRLLPLSLLIALSCLVLGLALGSASLSPGTVAQALFGSADPITATIVVHLRLPRVLAAFGCGALLALAGTLFQALLRNPLADPYILGISGGAAVGALSAILVGVAAALVNLAALGGALGAMALVFLLSRGSAAWDMHRLLLTGVVLSAGFGALISLLLSLAPLMEARGMLFWLMGDLSQAQTPWAVWLAVPLLLGVALYAAPSLDVLTLGEAKAQSLGVAVRPLQGLLYFAASAATAVAVMEGGAIGFVGLIVPHALRLAGVNRHRHLLLLAALGGGSLLVLADALARSVAAPQQLPVGVLTALLGVPALLLLLRRQ
ncbi:MAG: iron ABC transporter permease [Sulfuricella sp.]|nr:iron ABC transporter permease [Sulfuricella sp.]